ncbi:DegV family protein [Rhabdothermincola salaria]|uniref:DegV family protein n=1 Tax=Rhabdothermincola salaria TaxID=2903142 RepID=UPI001E592A1E|nr:DegV family protein [Rhabdothermincola salaria]MCD9624462.1 DegV family protein [Rhabdothermincola salaria]
MAGVRIVTDSSCDLDEADTTALDIGVVPLSIRFGDDEYVDREELDVERFYSLMDSTGLLPETAAPSPGRFEQAFRDAQAAGADAVVCINLSSALSATMQSAQAAARALEGEVDVRVVDSRSITGGLGTMVLEAATMARDGADADAIVARVESMIPRTDIYGALNTLDNLKKGGRIGGAQHLLGSMLSVKPLIRIVDGAVEEAGKPRTRRRALETLRDKLYEAGEVESLSILHGEATDIDDFLDMISDRYPRDTIRLGKIGAVIGTHGGPAVIGICYLRS